MLSKSQARAFFLTGTGLFSAVFVGLTVDTFQRIPSQTNAADLSPQVIQGKHLFEKSNCMGCHTIFGEGAYYAPELTKVYERRGETFIQAMLRDPEAMYPGQRKMTNYHFNEEEIVALTAFLKWVGKVDLNGFPPKPDLLRTAAPASANGAQGQESLVETKDRPKAFNQLCIACHSLRGQGGTVGPALDDVGNRRDREYISNWLHDPAKVKPDAKMPKLPLTEEDIVELSAFLANQKGS